MKILIAGASGLVGSHLVAYWQDKHDIYVLGRNRAKLQQKFAEKVTALTWNDLPQYDPSQFSAVINLAGETINHLRWTKTVKKSVLESRITATEKLVMWCVHAELRKPRLLNASALGIYGWHDTCLVSPDSDKEPVKPHPDFLAKVARQWENEAHKAEAFGVPVTYMRFAMILAKNAGALPKLLSPIKLGLGGRLGSGEQPVSWVSIDDLVRAIDFILKHEMEGAINIVAPECLPQKVFAKTLAQALHRPCFNRTPAFLLRALFGEMAEALILHGQHAVPDRLLQQGFHFEDYPLTTALCNLNIA